MLELRLLGGFEARFPGGEPLAISSRKTRALLGYLALQPDRLVPRDELIAILWSQRVDRFGSNSLSQVATSLRKIFAASETSPIDIRADGLLFQADLAQVDALQLERHVASGTPEDLDTAESLFRGDLLAGIGIRDAAFEDWLGLERARLRNLATEALTRLLKHRATAGHHAALVATAQKLLRLDPMCEPAHQALIRLYAEQGQTGLALRQYRQCVDVLRRDLGVEPSPETIQLYQSIAARPAAASGAEIVTSRAATTDTPPDLPAESIVERKLVTALCAEITSVGSLFEGLPPDRAEAVLSSGMSGFRAAIAPYGGTVLRATESRMLCIFGAPAAIADHATKACMAALEMSRSVHRLGNELDGYRGTMPGFRAALDSGIVIVRSPSGAERSELNALGLAVQSASNIVENGDFSGVRLTARTARLVEDFMELVPLGILDLKGFDIPVEVSALSAEKPVRTRFEARVSRGTAPFVGRGPETEFLSRKLEQSSAGSGQFVGIVGLPGTGKSRLLHEFARHSVPPGWRTLQCGAVSHRVASPWRPVVKVLRGLFHVEPGDPDAVIDERIEVHLSTRGDELKAGLVTLRGLLGANAEPSTRTSSDPRERRSQMIEHLRVLLTVESELQPLILVFEDLQWFDDESLALLGAMIRSLANRRLLVLASYRPEFDHDWHGLSAYAQLRVDTLDVTDSRSLASSFLGTDPSVFPLIDALVRRANGNPLFIEEGARDLLERGGLVGRPGDLRRVSSQPELQLPDSTHAIIAERMDRLTPRQKSLLQDAAVIGNAVAVSLLKTVSGLAELDFSAEIAELQQSDFLVETRLVPTRELSFKHVITQEVAYDSLSRDRKTHAHWRVGDALERGLGDHNAESADALGMHFEMAGDYRRAANYLSVAADRSRDQYAPVAALSFYARARTAIEKATWPQPVEQQKHLRHVLENQGRLQSLLGNAKDAQATFQTLQGLARASGDKLGEAVALQRTAQLAVAAVAYDAGIRDAAQALQIAWQIDDKPLAVRSLITLGDVHIHGIRGEDESGVRFLEEAIPICREIGDEVGLSEALYHLGYIRLLKGDYPNALALFGESLELARARDDRARVAFDQIFTGIVRMDLGEFGPAQQELVAGIETAQQIGAQMLATIGQTFLAWLMVKRSDYAQAIPMLDAAARVFEAAGARGWIPLVQDIQGECWWRQGNVAEARASFERALPLAREVADPCWQSFALNGLAQIHGVQGDLETAEAYHLESLKFCAMKSDMWVRCRAEAMLSWADVQMRCGEIDTALRLATGLRERSDSLGMRQFSAAARFMEGKVLMKSGRVTEAATPLQAAAMLATQIGDQALHDEVAQVLKGLKKS